MRIKNSAFIKSCASPDEACGGKYAPQIAVAGRSNCGKSSLLNMVMGAKLCKTSSTPGRTRLINIFGVNAAGESGDGRFYLIDLPGYGFHSAQKSEGDEWSERTSAYFETCKDIAQVLCLMDVRRDPSDLDKVLINYLRDLGLPFTVVLTKADKLSRAANADARIKIAAALGLARDNLVVTSSKTSAGKDELLTRLGHAIDVFNEE